MADTYRVILVSTDLSETGNAALPHALKLAPQGAKVYVLHALDLHHTPSPLYAHYTPGHIMSDREKAELKEKVAAQINQLLPSEREEDIEIVVTEDLWPPVEAVIQVAEERGAEVIVMGSHGLTGSAHLLLGSTAEHVIRRSRVPVLVVPKP